MTLGDAAVFYGGLAITIFLRYGLLEFDKWWALHFLPFSILFVLWIVIFMIAGLYDPLLFSAKRESRERIIRSMAAAGIVGIILFYTVPQFVITPKTNLVMSLAFSTALAVLWRKFYGFVLAGSAKTRVIFFGLSAEVRELMNLLLNTPHLGYEPTSIILPAATEGGRGLPLPVYIFDHRLPDLISDQRVNLVVASTDIHSNTNFIKMLYQVLPTGVAYVNFPQFYERITGKIPVSMISEIWFLENLAEIEKGGFEIVKRMLDIIAGLILGVLALCFLPVIALAIKVDSRGPVFFRQKRLGKNGEIFELIKLRTMIQNAENGKAIWAKENDTRVTRVGKILRNIRLDELPQLWNVIRGEMSLIGPRPERPEFVSELKEKIPHYMMRLLVRPGLSGWAQINFPYGASVEDAMEKLQYDLFYIKNRSLGLDLTIALKTLFIMISRSGR